MAILYSLVFVLTQVVFICSGENVEDAFLDTAKKIYQNIQDGRCVQLLFCLRLSLKSAAHNTYSLCSGGRSRGRVQGVHLPPPP